VAEEEKPGALEKHRDQGTLTELSKHFKGTLIGNVWGTFRKLFGSVYKRLLFDYIDPKSKPPSD